MIFTFILPPTAPTVCTIPYQQPIYLLARLRYAICIRDCQPNSYVVHFSYSIFWGFRYKLWKPELRSAMESDMKSVSEGTKGKDAVLATSLDKMKACFLHVCFYLPFVLHVIYLNKAILLWRLWTSMVDTLYVYTGKIE